MRRSVKEAIYPLLMPRKNNLTSLIVNNAHKRNLHAEVGTLVSILHVGQKI